MTASAINMQVYTQTNWSPTAYPARVHTANRTSYDSFGVVPFASGAILAVQATKKLAKTKSYADIAKGGTVRDQTKTVTIAVAQDRKSVV